MSESFFNKVAGLSHLSETKKMQANVFIFEFCEIFLRTSRTPLVNCFWAGFCVKSC